MLRESQLLAETARDSHEQSGDTVQASADQFAQLVGTLTTAGVALTVDNQNSASHLKFWTGSQAQYNSLTPDPNTLYFII
jgi:hypothetical protein